MGYPPKCEICENYKIGIRGYKICVIFDADVLSMAGNGIDFDLCQRYLRKSMV